MTGSTTKKVLFVVPYPVGEAPSQRFRFEQYFSYLRANDIGYSCAAFWDTDSWRILYKPGNRIRKLRALVAGVLGRVGLLRKLGKYDLIFVHREMAPVGPALFEWLVARVFRKRLVYDFDDAIWLPRSSLDNRSVERLKWYSKVDRICSWATRVSCGNDYLRQYAARFNEDVVVNPTVVDTDSYHRPKRNNKSGTVTIGWTGTHTTIGFLEPLVSVLRELSESKAVRIRVIADRKPDFSWPGLEFVPWSKQTEIEDLLALDIGVMPLPDTEWAKGKCGFKILQYMALGIPAVASAAGVNGEIIDNGVDGFLCNDREEWKQRLAQLLDDADLRRRFAEAGRRKVVDRYSVASNARRFLQTLAWNHAAKET